MTSDRILIDIRTSELTLSEALDLVSDYKAANPDREVFLDGDAHAIVSREVIA